MCKLYQVIVEEKAETPADLTAKGMTARGVQKSYIIKCKDLIEVVEYLKCLGVEALSINSVDKNKMADIIDLTITK